MLIFGAISLSKRSPPPLPTQVVFSDLQLLFLTKHSFLTIVLS
jgi:hypothetical protein